MPLLSSVPSCSSLLMIKQVQSQSILLMFIISYVAPEKKYWHVNAEKCYMSCCQSLGFVFRAHVALMMQVDITKTVQWTSYFSVHVTWCLQLLVCWRKAGVNKKWSRTKRFFLWSGTNEDILHPLSMIKYHSLKCSLTHTYLYKCFLYFLLC